MVKEVNQVSSIEEAPVESSRTRLVEEEEETEEVQQPYKSFKIVPEDE